MTDPLECSPPLRMVPRKWQDVWYARLAEELKEMEAEDVATD